MSISSYRSLDGLRVCGSSLPPPYIFSQDHVWIHFHSDDTLTGKGFRLSYITGERDSEGLDLQKEVPVSLSCSWNRSCCD